MDRVVYFSQITENPAYVVILCESGNYVDSDKPYAVHILRIWGEKYIYVRTVTECAERYEANNSYQWAKYGIAEETDETEYLRQTAGWDGSPYKPQF